MPALPISDKDSAWNYWKAGLVAAANVGLSLNASSQDTVTPTLRNLALQKGYNAIRLQLAWADKFSVQAADIEKIAANGWNTSQLNTAGVPISTVAAQIDQILTLSKKLGVGVILAVMDFHQGVNGTLWQQQSLQDQLVAFWSATAQRWPAASWPQLIGYDILNEPIPQQNLSFDELNADTTASGQANLNNWRVLANRITAAIRSTDSKTPILVEGIYGGAPRGLDVFRNLANASDRSRLVQDSANRIVYSFHLYAPLPFTHQGVTDWAYEAMGSIYADAASNYWHVWDYYNPDPATRGGVDLSQTFSGASSLLSYYMNDAYYANRDPKNPGNPTQAFHTQFGVPIFVGEFSAIDTSMSKSSVVTPDNPHRSITAITIQNKVVTITLGQLDSQGFRVDLGPSSAGDSFPFTNTVQVTITGSGTELDGINFTATLKAGEKTFTFPTTSTSTLNVGGTGSSQIATLTLRPTADKAAKADDSRMQYTRDVLKFCADQGFSWAWHFEDNELANEFNGWRPSSSVRTLLRAAAAGQLI